MKIYMKVLQIAFLGLITVPFFASCGSMNLDDYIQKSSESFCKKYDECFTDQEKSDMAQYVGYSNYDECVSKMEQNAKDSDQYKAIKDGTCDFNSDNAQKCLDHFDKEYTCDDMKGKGSYQDDPSCNEVVSGSDPVCQNQNK